MAEMTKQEFEAANARGLAYADYHPIALAARYNRSNDRVIVDLANGCTFAFPPRLIQGLQDATQEQLAQVYTGSGIGLHWDDLDVDVTVAGLVNGIFGSRKWMASQAGRASSPAKIAAARENGKKGGRPRKKAGGPI